MFSMKLAAIAMLPLLLASSVVAAQTPPPAQPAKPGPTQPAKPTPTQRPRATPSSAPTTATITVTDQAGAPLADVRVNLTGLDRSIWIDTD